VSEIVGGSTHCRFGDGSVVSLGIMYVDPKFSLKKYTFWPQVFISYFLAAPTV